MFSKSTMQVKGGWYTPGGNRGWDRLEGTGKCHVARAALHCTAGQMQDGPYGHLVPLVPRKQRSNAVASGGLFGAWLGGGEVALGCN